MIFNFKKNNKKPDSEIKDKDKEKNNEQDQAKTKEKDKTQKLEKEKKIVLKPKPKKEPKPKPKRAPRISLKEKNQRKFNDDLEEQNVEVLNKKELGVKVTKKNIFELLDKDGGKNKVLVDAKIAKILKKASSKKRAKDEQKALTNSKDAIIEVRNVSKYYLSGNVVTRVLKDISVTINKGEFVLIYGKSGGGKSTLLNLISGLDRPNNGHIIVCDTNLPYYSDSQLTYFRRKHVSFIFQNYNLLNNLNGYDNVLTGAYLQKDKSKKLDIDELFKEFDLLDIKDKYPSQMSGGQQQRVSILRALAKNAEIIFADEPTGALDEKTSQIVLSYLVDINQKLKTTIVMVTHDPKATEIANKVITVSKGKIESVKINKSPKHPKEIYLH
ncbi:ABC transporter ATP-binding protein [Mycoplasmopsis synoviae]|uniref:ABC transporter ATP-binding protein n=1 Tax=Mycoplasmopsis synoviae TaxID=2109 RepID=UPI00307A07EE